MIEADLSKADLRNAPEASAGVRRLCRCEGRRIVVKDPGAGADLYHEVYFHEATNTVYVERTLEAVRR